MDLGPALDNDTSGKMLLRSTSACGMSRNGGYTTCLCPSNP